MSLTTHALKSGRAVAVLLLVIEVSLMEISLSILKLHYGVTASI